MLLLLVTNTGGRYVMHVRLAPLSCLHHHTHTPCRYALPKDGAMPTELTGGSKVEFDEPAYTLAGGASRGFWEA
jgi:hypothetical protein